MSLTDIVSNGSQPLEGELAFDSVGSRLVAHMNGVNIFFPKDAVGNRAFLQSTLVVNQQQASDPGVATISLLSGGRFRMSDQSAYSLSSDLSVTVSAVHAVTPFVAGWNYLYLRNLSGSPSLAVSSAYGAFSGQISGPCAYVGSVFVTMSGTTPVLDPARRVGTHYYYHRVIRQSFSPAAGSVLDSILLPTTANLATAYAHDAAGACFSYSLETTGDGPCVFGLFNLPRDTNGNFTLSYSSNGTSTAVDVDLQGYEESVDTTR